MDWVKTRTHVIDHARFLEAGSAARDLWHWGMLYAGKHETDGEIPMAALMASTWGKGGKANVLIASRLVAVGLWERTDSGWRILKWAEQGNQTKAQIVADREAARERMKKKRTPSQPTRSPELRENFARSSPDVPTSTSYSSSVSDLGSRESTPSATPPEWWEGTCGAVEMATGEQFNHAAAWLRYSGHRRDKGRSLTANDAQQFLVSVDVKERRQERHREQVSRDIVKQRDEARAPKPEPVWRPPADDADAATPEEHARFAAELQRRLASGGR